MQAATQNRLERVSGESEASEFVRGEEREMMRSIFRAPIRFASVRLNAKKLTPNLQANHLVATFHSPAPIKGLPPDWGAGGGGEVGEPREI